MSKKKSKRLNDLTAAQIRIHNLEIAVVVMCKAIEEMHPDPHQADQVRSMATHLFEANTAARGYSAPRMIIPEVADPV